MKSLKVVLSISLASALLALGLAGCGKTSSSIESTASPFAAPSSSEEESHSGDAGMTVDDSSSSDASPQTHTPSQSPPDAEYTLSDEERSYVELLAQYIHTPTEDIGRLKTDPYFVAFLLDQVWAEGRLDGSLSMSEADGSYGQVLIPLALLNDTAQELFGISCDEDYIAELYPLSSYNEIIYYPTDRPFLLSQAEGASRDGSIITVAVSVTPAGDGGVASQEERLFYDFSPEERLRLLRIYKQA